MATSATREANRRIILRTVAEIAGPTADGRVLLPTAKRESNFNHRVDAKHSADVDGATQVFNRLRDTTYKVNLWRDRPELWQTSRGLFQLMVPYHVTKLGADWAPTVLWHPVAATIAAARLINRLAAAGAKNMCEVRSGWAGGPGYWTRDPTFAERCASLRNRLQAMGLPVELADRPISSFGLAPFGTGPKGSDNAVINALSAKFGIPGIGARGDKTLSYPEDYAGAQVPDTTPQTTPSKPKETPKQTPHTPQTPTKPKFRAGNVAMFSAIAVLIGAWLGDR